MKECKNVENAPKPSMKYLEDKICKIKQNKYSSNPKDIFKSAKKNKTLKSLTLPYLKF